MTRIFRSLKLGALLIATCAAVPASAQEAPSGDSRPAQDSEASTTDPARLALARQLVDFVIPPDDVEWIAPLLEAITGPELRVLRESEEMKQMFQEMPRLRPVFDRFIDRALAAERQLMIDNLPGLRQAIAQTYADSYSADELTEVLAFYQTPTGQRFAGRSFTLASSAPMTRWQTQIARLSRDRMQTLQASFMEELSNEIAKQRE